MAGPGAVAWAATGNAIGTRVRLRLGSSITARLGGVLPRLGMPPIIRRTPFAAQARSGQRVGRGADVLDAEPVGDVLVADAERGARGAPVPLPHSPSPGRSVSRKVAMKKPCGAGSVPISLAPHGSVRLKKRTSARVSSLIGGVPFETRLGSAK